MAQIRDGCLRVVAITNRDIDCLNLHDSKGDLVSIERDHPEYSDSLRQTLNELEPGNCIRALYQSEDALRPDGVWRFLDIDRYDETEYHALRIEDPVVQDQIHLFESLDNGGRSEAEKVKENGEFIGFKMAVTDRMGPDRSGPRLNKLKDTTRAMRNFGEPPFEIVSYVSPQLPAEIRYCLWDTESEIAEEIKTAGEYLVGHERTHTESS